MADKRPSPRGKAPVMVRIMAWPVLFCAADTGMPPDENRAPTLANPAAWQTDPS